MKECNQSFQGEFPWFKKNGFALVLDNVAEPSKPRALGWQADMKVLPKQFDQRGGAVGLLEYSMEGADP